MEEGDNYKEEREKKKNEKRNKWFLTIVKKGQDRTKRLFRRR